MAKITQLMRDEIMRLYLVGNSLREIEKKTPISLSNVHMVIKAHKMTQVDVKQRDYEATRRKAEKLQGRKFITDEIKIDRNKERQKQKHQRQQHKTTAEQLKEIANIRNAINYYRRKGITTGSQAAQNCQNPEAIGIRDYGAFNSSHGIEKKIKLLERLKKHLNSMLTTGKVRRVFIKTIVLKP